jgi:hypothetical protein
MKIRKYILKLFVVPIIVCIFPLHGYALSKPTHSAINQHIAQNVIADFSFDEYLREQVGFQKGVDEIIKREGIAQIKGKPPTIFRWVGYGGREEDRIPRMKNHFHNPLTNKGLYGVLNSAVEWATMDNGTQEPARDNYSWYDVRDYFHKALASKDKIDRDYYFALTFQGLGQLMHLVQDMSVPGHTRDDWHALGSGYEAWVKNPSNVNIASYVPIFSPCQSTNHTGR